MAASSMDTLVQHLRRTLMVRDAAGMTDGQLLHAFITHNDEAAYQALVQRHGPMVLGVCRRILRHQQDAEDAFQATFLVLVRKATSVKPRELVANWLHGVAYHTALKARAVIAKRKMRERQVPEMPEPQTAKPDDWHDLEPLLDEALAGLPDRYRLPILLCDIEGKSIKEATRQLGWPQGTLAGRLARGRKLLARRLTQRGVVLSSAALATLLAEKAASACVPAPLAVSTTKAAVAIAAGQLAAPSLVSAKVATLMEGVMKGMLLTKLKTVAVGFLALCVVAFGGGLLQHQRAIGQQSNAQQEGAEQGGAEKPPSRKAAVSKSLDEEKLHGEWTDNENGLISLIFGPGDTVRRIMQNGAILNGLDDTGTYSVDWTKTPYHLDLKLTVKRIDPAGKPHVMQTIMEFVEPGKLRIEISGGDEARPKAFSDETIVLTKKVIPPIGSEKAKADAAKDLATGEFYQRTGKYGSAYFYYELVRRRYPGTESAKRATELLDELNKHRIRLLDGSEVWETTEPTQPQPAPKVVDQTPTYDGASGQALAQLREQVKKLDRRLSELESPPGKRTNESGQRRAEQLLELALGAKSDVARLPNKLWFGSQGMFVATNTITVEKDGRIRLVPFRAVMLGKGESAESTVLSSEEVVLTLDKPISTIAELGNRRVVATQFVGLAEMKLIQGATPVRP